MATKFFKCGKCGNEVTIVDAKCTGLTCCGEALKELKANTSDGAQEKHVPVITVDGNSVTVQVGSVEHPMQDDHYIEWVYIETKHGGQQKFLHPGDKPVVRFVLDADEAVAAYAYCNKHGLWTAAV